VDLKRAASRHLKQNEAELFNWTITKPQTDSRTVRPLV
jgi:hypothetical protein